MSQLSHRYSTDWHCKTCQGWHRDGACCPATTVPTLTPEAQAVLEKAAAWRSGRDLMIVRAEGSGAEQLFEAVDAYRATLPRKDYAPEELKPGTRFRFSRGTRVGGDDKAHWRDPRMMIEGEYGKRYYVNLLGFSLHEFDPSDRIIPLPDQDA